MGKIRVLITGAGGYIGSRLAADMKDAFDVVAAGRPGTAGLMPLDLASAASIKTAVRDARPDAVVHAAAISSPDACEENTSLSRRVNLDAVAELASACRKEGARLIHFSTDLVFDGKASLYREGDATGPLGHYAWLKLESERAALDACPTSAVLRVSAAYGPAPLGGGNFFSGLKASLERGQAVKAFTDQWRSPTPMAQLAPAVAGLIAKPQLKGVFHWGGAQRLSRFEFAVEVCRALGFDPGLVEPASASSLTLRSPRPRDCSLDSALLSAALGLAPLTVREGLSEITEG